MIINGFIWDEWNKQHVARHDIAPDEVDEMLNHPWVVTTTKNKIRWAFYGITDGNRLLVAIIEPRDNDFYYPITAFDMDHEDREFYKKEVTT